MITPEAKITACFFDKLFLRKCSVAYTFICVHKSGFLLDLTEKHHREDKSNHAAFLLISLPVPCYQSTFPANTNIFSVSCNHKHNSCKNVCVCYVSGKV